MRFLGMDVGTGGTRAVVVDEAGKLLGTASSAHAPFRAEHPGWAEQDPEDWWRAAQEAIRDALAAVREPRQPIAALALTGQMHGAVMLDEHGQVLRPSLIWCDTRTQPECDWLTEKIGRQRLIELTCNPALPNFTLTKLLWVKKHQPEIFSRIRHVMCPKDYVRYRLTGEFAIDVQEASGTLLLDVTHRRWSREVAEAAGIPESWLPRVFESPEVCARISEEAAARTGLKAGTPVAAGAGDQGAGAVGMGILQPGSVSATIGTSGVVFAATAQPTKDPRGRLHTFCHAVPGVWHVMGVTQSAGLSLSWLKETFFAGQSYDALNAQAAKVPICLVSAPRTSIPKSAPHLPASAPATPPATWSAPSSRASPIRSKTHSRSSPSSAFPSAMSVSAAEAPAANSGAASRPAFTGFPLKSSSPKKAALSAARSWPESPPATGPTLMKPAPRASRSPAASNPTRPTKQLTKPAMLTGANSIPRCAACDELPSMTPLASKPQPLR
jgi:sugar (pentulose or hexulose) kinase